MRRGKINSIRFICNMCSMHRKGRDFPGWGVEVISWQEDEGSMCRGTFEKLEMRAKDIHRKRTVHTG